jgi:hypothetical protein
MELMFDILDGIAIFYLLLGMLLIVMWLKG